MTSSWNQSNIEKRTTALEALLEISRQLTSELDLENLLRQIINAAVEVLDGTSGSLLVWDPTDDSLVFAVTRGEESKKLENKRISTREGIAGWVFSLRQPVIVDDVRNDGRFSAIIDESLGYRTTSLIGVPLIAKGERIGVIEILNKKSGEKFDELDLEILTALANQAAIAIRNARLYLALREERDRIMDLEEEVHHRLARELHDGPAQTLASMIMSLDFIEKAMERDREAVRQELNALRESVARYLQQVRTLLFEMRPIILETQGLEEALRTYVERLRQTEDLAIHLSIKGLEKRLPQKVEEMCFGVVQEAFNNIKKHAKARNVWLSVERAGERLTLEVKDDGVGFDLREVGQDYARRGSLGLLNIRERAETVGGQVSIKSRPGKGTSIKMTVPLSDL
ncbi:MAG: GAF domain-containing sensor histidine kinase [Anaerolineae bacterium]